jgi:hypothetical protein
MPQSSLSPLLISGGREEEEVARKSDRKFNFKQDLDCICTMIKVCELITTQTLSIE